MNPRRIEVTFHGQPLPKARARITGKRVFTPERQKQNEEALAWAIRLACKNHMFEGSVKVEARFYRESLVDADLDNLLKQALDAANGIAWIDDKQVVEFSARKDCDRENPRTELVITDA